MKNVEICVCYHKESKLFENECLKPIQVGADCTDLELGLEKDNTLDNISYKNFHYAELTAMYWLWKNSNAKVKGLLHYRRFLDLYKEINGTEELYTVQYDDISDTNQFLDSLGLTEKRINELLEDYDIITRTKQNLRIWSHYTVKTHYQKEHTAAHLDLATEAIKKLYPQYLNTWKNLLNQTYSYFTNTIIMKSSDYNCFCEWLFNILFEVERSINLYDAELAPNTKKARWAGFLGERLTALYIIYQKENGKKVAEFPSVVLEEQNQSWHDVNTYENKNSIETSNIIIPTQDEAPILSVCVAVYNTSKYLTKCLDSIINSSLKNIEIICINDGSTDNSLEILNDYAQKDSRFIVFSQENGGLGTVRNKCLSLAKGKYIFFMDSDDFMDRDFLKNMVENAEKYNSEIVISTHRAVDEDTLKTYYTSTLMHTLNNKGTLNVQNCKDLLLVPCHVWDKIFKKDLIQDINFPPRGNGEDIYFWYKAILKAKNVSIHRKCEYNYRINFDSVQTKPKNIMNVFPSLEQTYNIFLNEYKLYKPLFDLFVYTLVCHMIYRGRLALLSNREFKKQFYDEICKLSEKIQITDEVKERIVWYNIKLNKLQRFKNIRTYADFQKVFKLKNCNKLLLGIAYNWLKFNIYNESKRKKYVPRIKNKLKQLPENAILDIAGIKVNIKKQKLNTYLSEVLTCAK